MYINESLTQKISLQSPQKKSFKITLLLISLTLVVLVGIKYDSYQAEKFQTLSIISSPQINDIYFLDFRLLSTSQRPNEKYRIAKVVDITGDIVTLVYGVLFYQHQHAAVSSIKFGQLSYKDYFEPKRYDLPLDKIKSMQKNQAIYLAKRPIRNKLFGNVVGIDKPKDPSSRLIYGKDENKKGEVFLKTQFSETNFKTAFELFKISSDYGYSKGQVNLAQMYVNGQHVEKNFEEALYWLKQASLQSYKPAILKYVIVCKQVELCNVFDFYDELMESGVNIKVRNLNGNVINKI